MKKPLVTLALFLLFLSVNAAQAQLPSRNPIDPLVWEKYSHLVLEQNLPDKKEFLRDVVITIDMNSDELSSKANLGNHKEIIISRGIIEFVETAAEYHGVLFHEAAHCVLKHQPTSLSFLDEFSPLGIELDMLLFEKQELEADRYSQDKLFQYDPCAMFNLRKRLNAIKGVKHDSTDPYDIVKIKRYVMLKSGCHAAGVKN